MIIHSHQEKLGITWLFWFYFAEKWVTCFHVLGEKPVFPARDALIDKRNLFLLSGRAVFRCMHKHLEETYVPTDRKNNFQILIICGNKLSKAKFYKSNFVRKITECNYLVTFYNSPYFHVNFFVIPVYFYYFTFCFKFCSPIAGIIVILLDILFLCSRKTNTKCYNKKTIKKSVARNIVASNKISFLIFVRLDLVVL